MGKLPVFVNGELAREIALRGLSQKEFAALAGVGEGTVTRALHGEPLRTKTLGKLLIALGKLPILNGEEVAS